MNKLLSFLVLVLFIAACRQGSGNRQVMNLNGVWEIAKTSSFSEIPSSFSAKIQVPGLVDMAEPKLDVQDTSYNNSVYWYKKSFKAGDGEVVQLKINKAAYHTQVYVNGKLAGENVRSFTPSIFNLKPFLNKESEENALVIAVGCRNNLPDTVVNGHDFEKIKYTPGIYDDVKLIVSGYPFISNVQTVPDIVNGEVRVVAELGLGESTRSAAINYQLSETKTGKVVAEGTSMSQLNLVDFKIKIPNCQLWSPENSFLYELKMTTSGDQSHTRFGMRTFEGKKGSSVFFLNGKSYYLRGTNVCIFRFFEDPERNGLPWDSKWVTKLHAQFKDMNWNSIRYCIGFPPERWYEIADSLGILIQDEFPVWTSGKEGFAQFQGKINSKQLAAEYRDWMRERWNHPCVVFWDAQNESVNDTTGKAIQMVRQLDLSNRPWDNGYAPPMSETDAIESHPYLFVKYFTGQNPSKAGCLKDLLSTVRMPHEDPNQHSPRSNGERYPNPVINNEYSWLWLNRDGTPTTLTDRVYQVAFPEAVTKEQKYEACAKNTAILTEYWRAYRKCAGVLHFCGLGYSRSTKPRGQTSDNFIDLKNLVYEPEFYKYVKPSFSPVGLMVEVWDKTFNPGAEILVPTHVFNDIGEDWSGTLKLVVAAGNETVSKQEMPVNLKIYEKKIINLKLKMPEVKGNYQLQAEIIYKGETVKSIRDFTVN